MLGALHLAASRDRRGVLLEPGGESYTEGVAFTGTVPPTDVCVAWKKLLFASPLPSVRGHSRAVLLRLPRDK